MVIDEALHVRLGQTFWALLQLAEIHQEHLLVGHTALQQRRGGNAGGFQNEAGFRDGLTEGIGLGRSALTIEPVGGNQSGTDTVAVGVLVTKHVEHGAIPAVDDVPEARSGMRGKWENRGWPCSGFTLCAVPADGNRRRPLCGG